MDPQVKEKPSILLHTRRANVPQVRRLPWMLHSRARALLFALGAGAAVSCAAFFSERYFHSQGVPALPMVAGSDALAGLFAGLLIVRFSYNAIEHREAFIERLRAIGEINHHVRNGLAAIQFSAHSTHNEAAVAAIRDGIDRIEWTLREIVGPAGPLADTSTWQKEHNRKNGDVKGDTLQVTGVR